MLSFDFRHVTELHGLANDGCQVSRSGQMRVASQQTDGPRTKLGYDIEEASWGSYMSCLGKNAAQSSLSLDQIEIWSAASQDTCP